MSRLILLYYEDNFGKYTHLIRFQEGGELTTVATQFVLVQAAIPKR